MCTILSEVKLEGIVGIRRLVMYSSKDLAISGFVKPGFEAVREAFVENFPRRNYRQKWTVFDKDGNYR